MFPIELSCYACGLIAGVSISECVLKFMLCCLLIMGFVKKVLDVQVMMLCTILWSFSSNLSSKINDGFLIFPHL